jgi:Skp family chaperone for outer membrane proteins
MNAHYRSWTQWIVMALVACLAIFVWEVLAIRRPTKPANQTSIAVVDVARVFKQHRLLNEEMSQIKAHIQHFTDDVIKNNLTSTKAHAPEIVTTDFSPEVQSVIAAKRVEFLRQEQEIYARVYGQIEIEVARVSRERGISLVVVDDSNDQDWVNADRDAIQTRIRRQVIYSQGLDITDEVVEALNAANP